MSHPDAVQRAMKEVFNGGTFTDGELEFLASYIKKHGFVRNDGHCLQINLLFCDCVRYMRNWSPEPKIEVCIIAKAAHIWTIKTLREIKGLIEDGTYSVPDREVLAVGEICLMEGYITPRHSGVSGNINLKRHLKEYVEERNERLKQAQVVPEHVL